MLLVQLFETVKKKKKTAKKKVNLMKNSRENRINTRSNHIWPNRYIIAADVYFVHAGKFSLAKIDTTRENPTSRRIILSKPRAKKKKK